MLDIIKNIYSLICNEILTNILSDNINENIDTLQTLLKNNRLKISKGVKKQIEIYLFNKDNYEEEIKNLTYAIYAIINNLTMLPKWHDKDIKGVDKRHKGYRHFHINNDLSMVYKISDYIYFIVIDNHKDLKKNKNNYTVV